MKNLIYIIIWVLFLFSCNKEDQTYYLTGRILKDCGLNPMANETFTLYIEHVKYLKGGSTRVTFTTDNTGEFCVEYKFGSGSLNPVIEYHGTSFFYFRHGSDIGTIYYQPTINFKAKIKINNTYSQGDTLRILENNQEIYNFSYPFSDTTLDTINNHFGYSQYNSINGVDTKLKVLLGLSYRIDSGQIRTTSFKVKGRGAYDNSSERFEGCQGNKVYQVELEVN